MSAPVDLREAASRAYTPNPKVGHVHFNTHHGVYQSRVSETRWENVPPQFVEWSDEQLAAWLRRLMDMRARARLLVARYETVG